MAPSELVGNIVDDVQAELNTVFNLDDVLGDDEDGETAVDSEPVTITVADDDAEDETDDEVNVDAGETGGEDDADGGDAAEGGDEDDAGDADEN